MAISNNIIPDCRNFHTWSIFEIAATEALPPPQLLRSAGVNPAKFVKVYLHMRVTLSDQVINSGTLSLYDSVALDINFHDKTGSLCLRLCIIYINVPFLLLAV